MLEGQEKSKNADLLYNQQGHNSEAVRVAFKVCGFNSLAEYVKSNGAPIDMTLPAGSTFADVVELLRIPRDKIFLAMCNGRDVTKELGAPVNLQTVIEEGDRVTFSGPVPYSWGYGAPVV